MTILTQEEAKKLYSSVPEYCHRMGQCGNCIHIKRTPKGIRPVRYYCLFASNMMLDGEDREFSDDDIIFIKKTDIPCNNGFEANTWWRNKVANIFKDNINFASKGKLQI